ALLLLFCHCERLKGFWLEGFWFARRSLGDVGPSVLQVAKVGKSPAFAACLKFSRQDQLPFFGAA
ncbi:MAG: hypothetical protein ABMA02_18075, partial [Saprospiraceae bacterium]